MLWSVHPRATAVPPPPLPVRATAVQVASRLWLVWGIIHPVTRPTTTGALRLADVGGPAVLPGLNIPLELNLVSLLLAWSCSEVIRYSFYAFKVSPGGSPDASVGTDGAAEIG